MSTRLLLPAAAAVTAISPTPDADWEDVSILARSVPGIASIADPMATVSFLDSDATSRDIIFRQYVWPLVAGQTITGGQAIELQVRCKQAGVDDMRTAVGVRVMAGDGTTVRKTMLAVTRDGTTCPTITLTNRRLTATSAATDYTPTVTGDCLVIEIGTGGDPALLNGHDSDLRLGDAAASDLPEDDTDTTDLRPWIEFADTWTEYSNYPYVGAAADDGTWYATGSGFDADLTNGDAVGESSGGGLGVSKAFYRIDGVPIAHGDTITSARLTLTGRSNSSGTTCRLRIKAVAEDDATAPTSYASAEAKSLTTAYVDWTPDPWTINTPYDSPDITAIIQEVVNRAGWASGNAICLFVMDNGSDANAIRRVVKFEDTVNMAYVTITSIAGSAELFSAALAQGNQPLFDRRFVAVPY